MEFLTEIAEFENAIGLGREVMGNTLRAWLAAALIFLGVTVVLLRLKSLLITRLTVFAARTSRRWDDDVVAVLSRTRGFFIFFLAVWFASLQLALPPEVIRGLQIVVTAASFLQLLLWLDTAVMIGTRRAMKGELQSHGSLASPKAIIISFLARFVVYVLVLLLFLDNLGVNITALVTGLGVGGVAVALAVQNILGDLFASLSIALDKPFEVGDFIVVGDVMGTVERVGLKTTRLRSLSGEQIIYPNRDLLQSKVRNFKRMEERRVVFRFGVEYDTSPAKIDEAQAIVKELVEAAEKTRFDRAHCVAFGAASLDFEVVYWVLSPEYNVYADIHHTIMRRMLERFSAAGIAFAFPTQTLYLRPDARDGANAGAAGPAGLGGLGGLSGLGNLGGSFAQRPERD